MIKTKIKRRYFILIHIVLIFFLCFCLLLVYSNKTSKKISLFANKYYEKQINIKLNTILKNVSNEVDTEILIIHKNNNDEIISADYDIKKTYELIDRLTSKLTKTVNKDDLKANIITVPFFVASNNVFLNNYGPKIKVKMYYMDTIIANIKTKITDYGMNNALVEAYIVISLDGKLITPLGQDEKKNTYELLISSKIINGRVPTLYGNNFTVSSLIFDIPIAS